ncbi:unnamed protein product [Echinostoma caproni]|uniref:TACC_C domain-containing protein n=1 Tax=Echinostoma caproni TaxID=27848 RepID=A0A183B554_9TREM|nr:unnamed protein product [Echinostoma caproni]
MTTCRPFALSVFAKVQLKQTADNFQTKTANLEKRCLELTQELANHQSLVNAAEAKLTEQETDSKQKLEDFQKYRRQTMEALVSDSPRL